ncbi:MAG TPA: phosphatidylcholine/phosphatidylserine synthase [Alphaproteobacteria bacterium]|nr:phosphatidylcholine/phosphatidylserine synthase [Alphaproteobacteria bacterium]
MAANYPDMIDKTTRRSTQASAWAVHALTGSGAALGLLALGAVIAGDPKGALLWLGAALLIDGLDGSLARKVNVKEALPWFSGDTLDLVIDYQNYVIIPAVFIHRFGLLPDALSLVGAIYIALTSLYCFCNLQMKSGDNYFVGFPAIWNVVALYLFVIPFPPLVSFAIVIVIGVLTFTTIKFVHPFRVRDFRYLNLGSTALWMLSSLVLILVHPVIPAWAAAVWAVTSVYFIAVCLWRTMRGPQL